MPDPEVLKRGTGLPREAPIRDSRNSTSPVPRCDCCAAMVERILRLTGAGKHSRVLELGVRHRRHGTSSLAPHVKEVVGVDLSPAGKSGRRAPTRRRLRIDNARFEEDSEVDGQFDVVMAIFFLHHLPDEDLAELPGKCVRDSAPGGVFYSLDPSSQRLSGAIGRVVIPWMMKRYRTADRTRTGGGVDMPVVPAMRASTQRVEIYDFGSSPLAG